MRKDRIDALGASSLVFFSLLMGLNQALVKLVNAGFAPVFQAGLRSAAAFLPILLFALLMRRRLCLTDGSFWPGIVVGCLFAFEFVLLFQALEFTSVSRASLFFYTMPLWVAGAAHFLIPGDRMTKAKAIGLVFAIAGVGLALGHNGGAASDQALLGDLMCLVAALGWAGLLLVARTTALQKSSPEQQLLYQLAVSAPIMLALACFMGETVRELTALHLAIFAFQVLVIASAGFLLWYWVLSIYPASQMASFSFLSPVFGVFFGWLIFDDPITWHIVAALGLVAIGIVLVNRRPA